MVSFPGFQLAGHTEKKERILIIKSRVRLQDFCLNSETWKDIFLTKKHPYLFNPDPNEPPSKIKSTPQYHSSVFSFLGKLLLLPHTLLQSVATEEN